MAKPVRPVEYVAYLVGGGAIDVRTGDVGHKAHEAAQILHVGLLPGQTARVTSDGYITKCEVDLPQNVHKSY